MCEYICFCVRREVSASMQVYCKYQMKGNTMSIQYNVQYSAFVEGGDKSYTGALH